MEQTDGDFLNFIVGETLTEFVLVNGSEFIDCFAAELLW